MDSELVGGKVKYIDGVASDVLDDGNGDVAGDVPADGDGQGEGDTPTDTPTTFGHFPNPFSFSFPFWYLWLASPKSVYVAHWDDEICRRV